MFMNSIRNMKKIKLKCVWLIFVITYLILLENYKVRCNEEVRQLGVVSVTNQSYSYHTVIDGLVSQSAQDDVFLRRNVRYLDPLNRESRSVPTDKSHKSKKLENRKPSFTHCSKYNPVIKEEQSPGTYVITVLAEDKDPQEDGGKITYKFITGPGEKRYFNIDEQTGEITTEHKFDRDEPVRQKETYITVQATDNGIPILADVCTIKVVIEDINDNVPMFDKVSYNEFVSEDLRVGHEAMRISATDIDDDNNSIVWYKLEGREEKNDYFKIDEASGVIILEKAIDKSPTHVFKLKATATDRGDPPLGTDIDVDITVLESSKKAPSFVEKPHMPISKPENFLKFDEPIATVKAISNIEGVPSLQFFLEVGRSEPTNKFKTFRLESNDDEAFIKLAKQLDYETVTEYTLTVRVQNKHKIATEIQIVIKVEDVNDNIPFFTELVSGSVPENEDIGTPVMQVRAIDLDGTSAHNIVEYELADHENLFTIDKYNGKITTLSKFDREEKSVYNVKVIAKDNSPSSLYTNGEHNKGEQVFRIDISDKNDNGPVFTQPVYRADRIKEDANINEFVIEVEAVDKDTASPVKYSIIEGNTNDSFSIESATGKVRVNNKLDYETWTNYILKIRAFDGQFFDESKVLINIANVNDNLPVFIGFVNSTEIEEESVPSYCITEIKAYDPDISDRNASQHIDFYLKNQNEFFSIDKNGCLRVTQKLDRDPPNTPERQLIIQLSDEDSGPMTQSTTKVFNVYLKDINDNAPELDMKESIVWYENQDPGIITKLRAKDIDSEENGPPFIFRLDPEDQGGFKDKFRIIESELHALITFDRETQKLYHIPIGITDNGKPPKTGISYLDVTIGDRNDHPMKPGSSEIFVYNYKGETADVKIGRVYVEDPDDWDLPDKYFKWADGSKHEFFTLEQETGMITMLKGVEDTTYRLNFRVTEESENITKHSVEATVDVTVKKIPEEAVDKSGSIRFVGISDEEFVEIPMLGGKSKKDILHESIAKLLNVSQDNVDLFTVLHSSVNSDKKTVYGVPNKTELDVRFSAHGSPYYSPEKLNMLVTQHKDQLENDLNSDKKIQTIKIKMINIDECIFEKLHCESYCINILNKNDNPYVVYTNKTSFVGVNAKVKPTCECPSPKQTVCLNNGTLDSDLRCKCPVGYTGPNCEIISIAFNGDGWAMYPPIESCKDMLISIDVKPYNDKGLIMYFGPVSYNPLLVVQDFLALELQDGYPVLMVDYGTGAVEVRHSKILKKHELNNIKINLTKSSVEMIVNDCKTSVCFATGTPVGKNQFLNVNSPLQLGGSSVNLSNLSREYKWSTTPTQIGFSGCISNLTINDIKTYNLGEPSYYLYGYPQCTDKLGAAASFGINSNFLVALLVCIALLIILLLAVVVHRRRQDPYNEKDLDDIRENIINYEDEGGGEVDTSYDLDVFPKHMLPPISNGIEKELRHDDVPDICGFLDNKKEVCDKDFESNPFDDVRHYAYEGDGDTSGSLSSLASCTDDGDLKFNYLSNFGSRFRKLADIYGEDSSDNDSQEAGEESWC